MRFRLWAIAIVACTSVGAFGKDPCVSGPQLGERPGPYSFLIASGPQRGQPTCYICETAEKPGIVVFARSVSAPLAKLMTKFDDAILAREKDGLKSWMTVLGEKTIGIDALGKWAKETGLKSAPVGVFDDPVGPPSYKLAEDADVTVLMFVDRKIVTNVAFRAGELNDEAIKKLTADAAKLAAKK